MEDTHEPLKHKKLHPFLRVGIIITCLAGLLLVYIYQRTNYLDFLPTFVDPVTNRYWVFAINRALRLLMNDFICMFLIYAIFQNARYMQVAFFVFCAELLIILPIYLAIKFTWEGDSEISSPLLSPIHRMVVNPLLMFILIAGFFYQRFLNERIE